MQKLKKILEGTSNRTYIVAEVAQSHDGSLGQAHAFIEAVAKTGADAIKFQTHIAAEESTMQEPFRVDFSYEDKTRYDYWKRMEFTKEQWNELYQHARELNLDFFSSPFSVQAFEMLRKIGVRTWKFGSGEVFNRVLLDKVLETEDIVLLSSGMSTYQDIGEMIGRVKEAGNLFGIFQCTTSYPCPPDKVGLNVIGELQKRFDCPVGLSDHSGTIYPALAAVPLGAKMLELHVAFSREMFGPDVLSSVTMEELKELVKGVRYLEQVLEHPVDKESLDEEREKLKSIFSKSLYAKIDIPEGTVLDLSNVAFKKPCLEIRTDDWSKVEGRVAKHDILKDTPICWSDIR